MTINLATRTHTAPENSADSLTRDEDSVDDYSTDTRGDSLTRLRNLIFDDPDYRHRAWLAIVVVAAVDWIWSWHAGLTIRGVLPISTAVAALLAIGSFYSVTGRDRKLADLGHYTALWLSFPVVVNLYSYSVATMRFPLRDATFSRMDAALGFHWASALAAVEPHHVLQFFLGYAYNSIYIQVIFSVVFFAMSGRRERNREMLWIGMVAALATTSLSGLVPALGPYVDNDIPRWSAVLLAIRDGSLTNIKIADMQGIVSFPSFHTVLALMLIYVHRPPSWTFAPMLILNILMLMAIPFAGHHYLIDVVAGAVVTMLSIIVVRRMFRTSAASSTTPRHLSASTASPA